MNLAYREAVGEKGAKPLPGSLRVNPRLSQWLKIVREGRVDVISGKVEIGQGILTALAQIAAEELDVSLERIRMVQASTAYSPDEAVTSGSLSVQESGTAIRHACAEARAIYLRAAAARLDVPVDSLTVRDGEIVGGSGLRTSYWELADDALLDRDATGTVAPKSASSHAVVGTAAPRRDLADKVFGRACFIHDLELPGMLHARMLRPPSPAATLRSLDESAVRSMPGVVQVVRDGSFVAVLAETEHAAKRAAGRLAGAAEWSEQANLPDEHAMAAWLKAQPAETTVVDTRTPQVPKPVARTVKATYSRPYVAHASLAPSCALAQADGDVLRIWTHSQGIYNLRKDLALAFGMPPEKIVIAHVQGAGCYGHHGADDVAFDAARLAKSAVNGRPVRVQWSRSDELAWSPVGAALRIPGQVSCTEAARERSRGLGNDRSHDRRPVEPYVAVNPANPQNIAAIWIDHGGAGLVAGVVGTPADAMPAAARVRKGINAVAIRFMSGFSGTTTLKAGQSACCAALPCPARATDCDDDRGRRAVRDRRPTAAERT